MFIYTLGYEGLSPELYATSLVKAGVKMVIDVRENPWSQRPAYVGSTLRRFLAVSGIDYAHWKALGNPASIRKTATSSLDCMRRYKTYLRANADALELLLNEIQRQWAVGTPICLTCYEKDHANCHRSVIIDQLRSHEPNLRPIHLEPTPIKAVRTGPRHDTSSTATAQLFRAK